MQRRIGLTGSVSLAVVLAVGAAVAGCGKKPASGGDKAGAASPAPASTPVVVTPAQQKTVTNQVAVNGNVTALQTVALSPKISAPVLTVVGREGDFVHAGQVIVQQDTSDLERQLEQDQANLQSAKAKLTQAQTNYRLQVTQSATGVQNAKAQLSAAQANLLLAKNPQRSEEIQQATIAVEQAKANYDRAVADRKRYEYLVKEGAAAQATLDQYITTEQVQKANLDNAVQGQKIAQTGGREESVRASQESVRQSEIALQLAQSNVAQNQAKLDDIHAAQASVAQSAAAVKLENQQIADASIRSPIDGVISIRATEPGQQAAPGTSVMTVVSLGTVYFQAQVPETEIGSAGPGKSVLVHVDALPGKSFTGKIAAIFPTASTSSRAFNVRVDVPNDANLLRPGMFARGQVIISRHEGIVVPKDALVAADSEGKTYQVFVAGSGGTKAERRPVKVGVRTDTTAEILTGVQAGDQVVTSGQDGLKDGAPITIVKGDEGGASPQLAEK